MELLERLVEIFSRIVSWGMLGKRVWINSAKLRLALLFKTMGMRQMVGEFQRILELMKTDREFRVFHEGESQTHPWVLSLPVRAFAGSVRNIVIPRGL